MTTPSGSHDHDTISAYKYFITQFRVITTYIRLLFIPVGQNLDYDFVLSHSFFDSKVFLSFLILAAVFLLAVVNFKRTKLIAFGVFWFFLTLLVESSIIPIHNVIFEHRMYLPSIGFSMAVCALGYRLMRYEKNFHIVMTGIVIIFGMLTFMRNNVWKDELTLWKDTAQKSPFKARVHINLGDLYLNRGQYKLSVEEYDKAEMLKPDEAHIYINRGIAYKNLGQYNFALQEFAQAFEIDPSNPFIFYNRGNVRLLMGNEDQALADYNHATDLDPSYVTAYITKGSLYGQQKRYDLAMNAFNRVIELDSNNALAFYYRSLIYKELRDYKKALEDALRARTLGYVVPDGYLLMLNQLAAREDRF